MKGTSFAHRMKVANKFALAFLGCGLAGMVLLALLVVDREAQYLEQTIASDLSSMTRAVALTARAASDDAAGRAIVEGLSDPARGLEVRWWAEGEALPPALREASPGEVVSWALTEDDDARRALAGVRIPTERGERAVVLSAPVAGRGALLRAAAAEELIAALTVALITAVLARVLGEWLIGRPLGRIITHARRVGDGDLDSRLTVRGSAEIAALKVELNRMSERLAESHARAEEEMRARLDALEQLRHVDRLRTVGTLASGIAHELGTPLNVIVLRARMLERVHPEVAPGARIIVEQAERVARIVRQLMDFARRKSPQRSEVDLAALCRRVVTLLEALAKKSGVNLEVTVPEAAVLVSADRAQIEQVLTNLVVNAVQASSPGMEVRLAVHQASARPPDGGPERRWACADVIDHGKGIPESDLPRIFEPFFTTKDVGEGTGLGLSVAYGIVRDHEGFLDVESRERQGSRFRMALPLGA